MKKTVLVVLTLSMLLLYTACDEQKHLQDDLSSPFVSQNSDSQEKKEEQSTSESSTGISVESLLSQPAVSEDQIFCSEDGNGGIILMDYSGTDTLVVLPDTYQNETITLGQEYVFGVASQVQAIKFPNGMTQTGDYICAANENLEVVVMGDQTETIGKYAFQNCTALHTVILNEGLQNISENAFAGCSNLKTITIPESVTYINYAAFYAHPDDFTICGIKGSAAESFANENGINFKAQ